MSVQDITPEGSAVPVFLDPTPQEPPGDPFPADPVESPSARLARILLAVTRGEPVTQEDAEFLESYGS